MQRTLVEVVRAIRTPGVACIQTGPDALFVDMELELVSAPDPVERLQDLILTRLRELGDKTGPMTAREAARRAEGLVSYETIRNLARGVRHTGRLTDRVAEGLSRALQVPVSRIYDAAGVPQPGERWDWPERFSRLTPAQRALVEDLAAALLEAYDRGARGRP